MTVFRVQRTIIQTVEVTPALVVLDRLPIHQLLEVYSFWRYDNLNIMCIELGEILGREFGTRA
jgi:hypothetical protein